MSLQFGKGGSQNGMHFLCGKACVKPINSICIAEIVWLWQTVAECDFLQGLGCRGMLCSAQYPMLSCQIVEMGFSYWQVCGKPHMPLCCSYVCNISTPGYRITLLTICTTYNCNTLVTCTKCPLGTACNRIWCWESTARSSSLLRHKHKTRLVFATSVFGNLGGSAG